jgi:hypothetical protein
MWQRRFWEHRIKDERDFALQKPISRWSDLDCFALGERSQ